MAPPEYGSTQDIYDDVEALEKKSESTGRTEFSDDDSSCCCCEDERPEGPTNEYVLNVAVLTFFGFMGLQAVFATIAHSQSMMADSEAMSVDAFTYLFNLLAERIKNRPPTPEELKLPLAVRQHRRKMIRLYLELFPPLLSVITLICVTIAVSVKAWRTLYGDLEAEEEDVSATLMFIFSLGNLLLDVVNVTCFARAQQAYGLQRKVDNNDDDDSCRDDEEAHENSKLLGNGTDNKLTVVDTSSAEHLARDSLFEKAFGRVNLNMCSAWTHIVADTMRSTAVLIAAAIAFLFDSVASDAADASAALVVSITILISLIPLIRGLFVTAKHLVIESRNKAAFIMET